MLQCRLPLRELPTSLILSAETAKLKIETTNIWSKWKYNIHSRDSILTWNMYKRPPSKHRLLKGTKKDLRWQNVC